MKSNPGFLIFEMIEMRFHKNSYLIFLLIVSLLCLFHFGCGKSTVGSKKESVPNKGERLDSNGERPKEAPKSHSEEELERAKAEGLPVLLNFHGKGCIPCEQMGRNLDEVKNEFEGKVKFVIVDVYDPSEYNLCMDYGIETIPTTVFLRRDGTVFKGYIGVMTPDEIRAQLNALLEAK